MSHDYYVKHLVYTEEIAAMGREIESRQGAAFKTHGKHSNHHIHKCPDETLAIPSVAVFQI
jgi:hypothetical protein